VQSPNWRQVVAVAGVVVPVVIASGLTVGGFQSHDVAYGLFAFAGLWAVGSIAFVPTTRALNRSHGHAPAQASHLLNDSSQVILLRLDRGDLLDVSELACEVQLPLGGVARATVPGDLNQDTMLNFPHEFSGAPSPWPAPYINHRVGGIYRVTWIATQFAANRGPVASDRFKVGPPHVPWRTRVRERLRRGE